MNTRQYDLVSQASNLSIVTETFRCLHLSLASL